MENQNDTQASLITRVAGFMVYLDAAYWIGYGVAAALGLIHGLPLGTAQQENSWILIAFGAAVFLLFTISRKYTWALFPLLGLLSLISLVALTDQSGILDWAAYALNLAALVLLILDLRKQGSAAP